MNKMEIKEITFGLILTFLCALVLFFSYFIGNYPLKYRAIIKRYSSEYNLSENLVTSVINVESGFKKNCVSSANAKGLMQLIDSTAEDISKKLNVDNYDLFDPNTNVRFGCYYLRFLIDYYDGNIENALCAYNAGLANVNNWLKDDNFAINGIKLINTPFQETNKYLEKIHSNQKIYKIIYAIK